MNKKKLTSTALFLMAPYTSFAQVSFEAEHASTHVEFRHQSDNSFNCGAWNTDPTTKAVAQNCEPGLMFQNIWNENASGGWVQAEPVNHHVEIHGGAVDCNSVVPTVSGNSIILHPSCAWMVQSTETWDVTCEEQGISSCDGLDAGEYRVYNWNNSIEQMVLRNVTESGDSGDTDDEEFPDPIVNASINDGDFDDDSGDWTTDGSIVWIGADDKVIQGSFVEQSFDVSPGSVLIVRGFARPTLGSASARTLEISLDYSSGGIETHTFLVDGWTDTSTVFTHEFNVPEGVSSATLRMEFATNDQSRFYYANVSSVGGDASETDSIVAKNPDDLFTTGEHYDDVDLIPFSHTNADGVPYGIANTTNQQGLYNDNSDVNDLDMTRSWGLNSNSVLILDGNADSRGVIRGQNSDGVDLDLGEHIIEGSSTNYVTNSDSDSGNFRIKCQWSHFAYDDPIVNHPDSGNKAPNKSHLHMFWGNTAVDWNTELEDDENDNYITKIGGSTCNGFALNRSSYWMPALMHENTHAIVPRQIIVYYKARDYSRPAAGSTEYNSAPDWQRAEWDTMTNNPIANTVDMPQGLQLISGNGDRGEADQFESLYSRNLNQRHASWGGVGDYRFVDGQKGDDWWTTSTYIMWQCGRNGFPRKKFNRIPTQAEWDDWCGDFNNDSGESLKAWLNATVYFQQCRRPDGTPDNLLLRSDSFREHVRFTKPDKGCPVGFSSRMPQLGYRVYWDLQDDIFNGEFSLDKLRLSSDPVTWESELKTLTRDDVIALEDSDATPMPRIENTDTPDADVEPQNRTPETSDLDVRPQLRTQRYRYANVEIKDEDCNVIRSEERVPGGTLHADWVSGWNKQLMKMWVENCGQDKVNCTIGQTGTSLKLSDEPADYTGHPDELLYNGEVIGDAGSYMLEVPGSMRGMSSCM